MRIVFRCDASKKIGWGHLIRCLAIAEELDKDNKIIFASIKDKSNKEIKNKRFRIFFKKSKEKERDFLKRIKKSLAPDVLVVDTKYKYKKDWFEGFKKVVMIDNFYKAKHGLKYAVLRKEVLRAKRNIEKNNIVLTTGASDPKGVLLKLVSLLKQMDLNVNIIALFGKSFSFSRELRKIKKDLPSNFQILPYSLKEIIRADIAICTFGQSIYEMIYLGIPTICVSHSKENARGAKFLKKRYGVIEDLGYIGHVSLTKLQKAVNNLLNNKEKYINKNLIDGKGAKRIAKIIR